MMIKNRVHLLIAVVIFTTCFYFIPYLQLNQFSNLPGDLGDSRLNHYFLENIYLFFAGRSPSLVNLSFFYPFPFILGFSDNLFGSYPIYFFARLFTRYPEEAFGIWYAMSYVVNFSSTYYVLRKLNVSNVGSITGAIIFTFAFPVSAQTSHVQLAYRFATPMAILGTIQFLRDQSWRSLLISFIWVTWQFYCSIYLGFFLGLMIGAMYIVYGFRTFLLCRNSKDAICSFLVGWRKLEIRSQTLFICCLLALIVCLVALFYPYLKVSELYGAKRSIAEIAGMLPTPGSYLLMEESWLWKFLGRYVSAMPMRHEHQIFFGAIPMALALIGLIFGSTKLNGLAFPLLAGPLIFLIVITLNFNGHSLWLYFADLPLASAIRAMTRISLVLLFPIAYLGAAAVDLMPQKIIFLKYTLILVMIFEFSTARVNSSPSSEWREHSMASIAKVPIDLPLSSILFFSQDPSRSIPNQELDAMWSALSMGLPTLNGYSGNIPAGFKQDYGMDCSEISRRLRAYLAFDRSTNPNEDYQDLIKRIVPIGFDDCNFAKIDNY
jgi:hypothetical protein